MCLNVLKMIYLFFFFFKDAVTSQVWCFSNNIDYKQMEEPKNDLVMVILLLIFLQK